MTAHRLLHDIRIICTNTGNHAKHIAVYCRNRLIICNRSNCTGGIRSDSFEFQQFLIGIRYHPTVFIVSQRTSSIQHADRIIVLDDGAAVGIGTHDELMKSCSVYQEIYNSQFKKEAV